MDDALRKLQSDLRTSGHRSIDAFLEEQSPEIVIAGKMAIVAALLPIEGGDRLFPPNAPSRDHWYEDLVQRLSVDDHKQFLRNRLSVITLNYDRSFDWYLHSVLWKRFSGRVPDASLLKCMNRIPVVHLHGSLGDLYGAHAITYGDHRLIDREGALRAAAKHIKVIHEPCPRSPEFITARRLLKEAKQIYFLGFGYHQGTLDRLGLFKETWSRERLSKVHVAGTSKGIPANHWRRICDHTFRGSLSNNRRYPFSVARFIREVARI